MPCVAVVAQGARTALPCPTELCPFLCLLGWRSLPLVPLCPLAGYVFSLSPTSSGGHQAVFCIPRALALPWQIQR